MFEVLARAEKYPGDQPLILQFWSGENKKAITRSTLDLPGKTRRAGLGKFELAVTADFDGGEWPI